MGGRWGGGGGRWGVGVGGQSGCEQRIEVFVKTQKKKLGGWGVGVGLGGQSGCERRIEVFVKIQKKKIFFWGGGGVGGPWGGRGRVGGSEWVNKELNFL